jgi:SAM-dependent methyltransferase
MVKKTFRQLEEAVEAISAESDINAFTMWEADYLRFHRTRYIKNLEDVNRFAVGKSILEVGSVPCHFTALLAMSGYEVIGIDLQPERVKKLIKRFSLDVVKCDIELEPLPFDNASFKTIMFSEVIEHLYVNPLYALRELARVLAPDGVLLLYTENLYGFRYIKSFLSGRSFNDAVIEWQKLDDLGHRGHIRVYSPKEIRGLLSVVGLTPIRQLYHIYDNNLDDELSFKSIMYRFAPRWLYPSQLVVATKTSRSSV